MTRTRFELLIKYVDTSCLWALRNIQLWRWLTFCRTSWAYSVRILRVLLVAQTLSHFPLRFIILIADDLRKYFNDDQSFIYLFFECTKQWKIIQFYAPSTTTVSSLRANPLERFIASTISVTKVCKVLIFSFHFKVLQHFKLARTFSPVEILKQNCRNWALQLVLLYTSLASAIPTQRLRTYSIILYFNNRRWNERNT